MREIVIKLPEKVINRILEYKEMPYTDLVIEAIYHGVQLPKGHGRLIDANEIEWYGCTTEFDCPHKDRACENCSRAECSKTQVDDIQPIIEADKESEDDG